MPATTSTTTSLKLWIVMNRAFRSIEEPLQRQVSSHGVSFTEFAVLEVLYHKGHLPIGDLGNRVLLTSGSMTYVVDKLVQRGLIRREACPEDRRVTYAVLTDDGRRLMEVIFPEHAELIRKLMEGLEEHEQKTMTELLKRLGLFAESHALPVS